MSIPNFQIIKILKSTKKSTIYEIEHDSKKGLLISNNFIEVENMNMVLSKTQLLTENDRYFSIKSDNIFLKIIFPATSDDFKKYFSPTKFTIESYEDFKKNYEKQPIIWIDNIINGKNIKETILFRDKDIVICVDEKWDGVSTDDLYIIALFTNRASCIRDATRDMLTNCKEKVIECLDTVYSLGYGDVLMFIHYPPSFYSLHVHVVSLKREFSDSLAVGRAILLDDAIRNLSLDKNYYKKDIFCIKKE
ncbi:m7GpppX diphosphatase [Dictyocoela roeselum]|nr:m7GpppX diphosphatase [Dictyocoela roeselum]